MDFQSVRVAAAAALEYDITMPTVLQSGPYRFFFYAGYEDEPPHVHVERDDCQAKFWIDPIRLQRSHGFAANEINKIERLVTTNQQHFLDRWNEFFIG